MTFEPNGELDLIVAESLRDRAAQATVQGRGIGEVRRRVRRRRQRQMAVGLVPAMAGMGWVVTRPAPHSPLSPGGDAAPCGQIPSSTWTPGSYPATTTWASDVTVSTISYDANGNVTDPYGNPLGTLSTGIVGPVVTDSNGNYVDGYGNVITVPYVTDADGYPATTVAYQISTTAPPWTGGATSTTIPYAYGLLIVNASHYGSADEAASFIYSGARTATATSTLAESVVMIQDGPTDLAATIARDLGIIDPTNGEARVQVGLDTSLLHSGTDLSGIKVIVLIGDDVAIELIDQWTSTVTTGPAGDSTTTTTICEPPSSTDVIPTTSSGDSTTTTSIVVGDLTSTKVQVANCSAQNGVARMMSTALADTGFVLVDATTGTCDPKIDTSYVIYDESVPGAKEVAESLGRILGGLHVEPGTLPLKVESAAWADGSGVVLYLGNDLAAKTLDEIQGATETTTPSSATMVPTVTT